jgi:hypothetical protein
VLLPVVARVTPFQLTAAEDAKPVPLTVSVKPLPPALVFCGVMEEMVGAELPPPVDPDPPEFPAPPEEQLANEIRTAAITAISHRREIPIEACTERALS